MPRQLVGGEVDDGIGDVVGPRDLRQRHRGGHAADKFMILQVLLRKWRDRPSGTDTVDPAAAIAGGVRRQPGDFVLQGAGKTISQRRLRRRIVTVPGLAKNTRRRGDHDDVALLLDPRQLEKLTAAKKNRRQISRHGLLPLVKRHVGDRNNLFAPDARIRDQGVDAAETPAGLREQRAHLRLIAQVRAGDERLNGSELAGQPLRLGPPRMVVQHQPCALRCKRPGHGGSQTARRSSDENDFAGKIGIHGFDAPLACHRPPSAVNGVMAVHAAFSTGCGRPPEAGYSMEEARERAHQVAAAAKITLQ